MNVSDFDYELPPECIAQTPAEPRDAARLLTLNRRNGAVAHHHFGELGDFLRAGDLLVRNDTRVIPARLAAVKHKTGGRVGLLLLRQLDEHRWLALMKGHGLRPGLRLNLPDSDIQAEVGEELPKGQRVLRFEPPLTSAVLAAIGQTPLPPYIREGLPDPERYQTVYSRHAGSAAAPTAGLHFTPALLERLRARGIQFADCTLHIGLDTFQPLRVENVTAHRMHSERAQLDEAGAARINAARERGGRVIAVGTTSARLLESAAQTGPHGRWQVAPLDRDTRLFITPGHRWRAVDALLTNFHLPRSTLLMMVSAFAGRENILHAYRIARDNGYRFYSFGDAMLIH